MLVALTGGLASGKSTVAQLFGELGAVVIRADDLAKEVIEVGGRAHCAVLEHFGPAIIENDGSINREKLANIVFNNPIELKALEEITHPAVQVELGNRLANIPDNSIVIYELPLLIEKNLFQKFDKTIAVISQLELRRIRAKARGISSADFDARILAQTSDEERLQSVDYTIYNDGTISQLAEQVKDIWTRLTT